MDLAHGYEGPPLEFPLLFTIHSKEGLPDLLVLLTREGLLDLPEGMLLKVAHTPQVLACCLPFAYTLAIAPLEPVGQEEVLQ